MVTLPNVLNALRLTLDLDSLHKNEGELIKLTKYNGLGHEVFTGVILKQEKTITTIRFIGNSFRDNVLIVSIITDLLALFGEEFDPIKCQFDKLNKDYNMTLEDETLGIAIHYEAVRIEIQTIVKC